MKGARTAAGLRATLLDLGYDAAEKAKIAREPSEIRDLIEAAADALRSVSDADQKQAMVGAISEAREAIKIGLAGALEGHKLGRPS